MCDLLLASPRLDTSRRPRIVLEIAAFSRYFLGLRSPRDPRVYPPPPPPEKAHPISDDLSDRRGSKDGPEISSSGKLSVTNYVSCRLTVADSWSSLRSPPFLLNFSPARIIVSDASSGNPLACRRRKQTALDIAARIIKIATGFSYGKLSLIKSQWLKVVKATLLSLCNVS